MITLFGATGFTGKKIARSLEDSNLPFRLAGRSFEKLQTFSSQLASRPAWIVADARQSATISALFLNTELFINCAAPFTDIGEKIVSLCAVNAVHYLDISNELGFVYRVKTYDRLTKHNQSVVVPAAGFEVALADCAAQVISSRFSGPFDRVDIVYQLPEHYSSPGTRRSVIRSLATSWIAYQNGGWIGEVPGKHVREFTFCDKGIYTLSIPSAESVTIPDHINVKNIHTWLKITPAQRFFAPIVIPYYARILRSILGKWILSSVSNAKPQAKNDLSETHFSIHVSLTKGSTSHSITLSGLDPYQLTAQIVAYAAGYILDPTFKASGVLAPSCIFNPAHFLDHAVSSWGISMEKSF